MTSVATLGAELVAYAAAVSLSPIHIGLLLLMLLGPNPIQRGSWFVLSWMVTIGGAVVVLLTVGHSLLLTMDQGSAHRTGLDLLAAGALLALGIKELLERREEGDEPPGWTRQLNRFSALPLPLLIAAGMGIVPRLTCDPRTKQQYERCQHQLPGEFGDGCGLASLLAAGEAGSDHLGDLMHRGTGPESIACGAQGQRGGDQRISEHRDRPIERDRRECVSHRLVACAGDGLGRDNG